MRILGIDFGTHRIGLAISDPLGLTAQPLAVVKRQNTAADLEALEKLVRQHGIQSLVVGLPLDLKGKQGPQAQRALSFGKALERLTALPVVWIDERFTTAQGLRALREMGQSSRKQKGMIDQAAAQLILQSYLDSLHAKKETGPN